MLSAIPSSKFREEDIQKLLRKIIGKRGPFRRKLLVTTTTRENMVWMPYYRVQYDYTFSKKSSLERPREMGHGETALNAMFCGCVEQERELLTLFRPNYLRYKRVSHLPEPREIVGPVAHVDLQTVLTRFLKRLNETKDELSELRPELRKDRMRISWHSIIFIPRDLREKEMKLSEKVAKLDAMKNTLSLCLNVEEDMGSIEVTGHDVFYYPTLVATLNHEEETEKYVIVNLVKSGLISKHLSCDRWLTELCNKNSMCKNIITKLVSS